MVIDVLNVIGILIGVTSNQWKMKLIKKDFVFESDEEIKEFIKLLKKMKKNKVSLWRSLPNGFGLHNGKPSIPDYNAGYKKSKLLRDGNI